MFVHNKSKWTISTDSRFELLQIVLEPDNRSASKTLDPQGMDGERIGKIFKFNAEIKKIKK